jgi:hypothetical protein
MRTSPLVCSNAKLNDKTTKLGRQDWERQAQEQGKVPAMMTVAL